MAEETHYTGKMGIVTISTANSNLDGTGTVGQLISGGSNGTYIKRIIIKAQGDTTMGMIRIFFSKNGTKMRTFLEVPVPEVNRDGDTPSFEATIWLGMRLEAENYIFVSTENAETFNVFAEGLDWSYYASSVRQDTTQLTAVNGLVNSIAANTSLTGSGSHTEIYGAGSSATFKGSSLKTITIKADNTISNENMVRLFYGDSSNKYLFKEIVMPRTPNPGASLDPPYIEEVIEFEDDFDIPANKSIYATIQTNDDFVITTEGTDWNYAS